MNIEHTLHNVRSLIEQERELDRLERVLFQTLSSPPDYDRECRIPLDVGHIAFNAAMRAAFISN